jgi:hypothetical protein
MFVHLAGAPSRRIDRLALLINIDARSKILYIFAKLEVACCFPFFER